MYDHGTVRKVTINLKVYVQGLVVVLADGHSVNQHPEVCLEYAPRIVCHQAVLMCWSAFVVVVCRLCRTNGSRRFCFAALQSRSRAFRSCCCRIQHKICP